MATHRVNVGVELRSGKPTPTSLMTVPSSELTSKQSVGIACVRFNGTKPEVLLVCKRYTYAYNDFIHGRYHTDILSSTRAHVTSLLNNMTIEEKLDILSLDFDKMWYRIWLNAPRTTFFAVAKNKFESMWVLDGGARLRKLIARSRNVSRIWEMPKGRKRTKTEPNIICAIREFGEETGLSKRHYKFIPGIERTYSFDDAGINYINTYYVAVMLNNHIEVSICFNTNDQVTEIGDIKWMSIEMIRCIDTEKRLENFIAPIFRIVKRAARLA